MLLKIYNPKDPKSKGAIEKMKKRRILAALLSCAMISTALIGCSGDGGSSSAASGDTSESQSSTEASTNGEKVKLTAIFVKHSLTKDLNTMQWLTDLQNECNVEVEWQQQIQP